MTAVRKFRNRCLPLTNLPPEKKLLGKNEENIKFQAERIRKKICGALMTFNGVELMISASFGVASFNSANNFINVINLADKALYTVKKEGRNRVVMADAPAQIVFPAMAEPVMNPR